MDGGSAEPIAQIKHLWHAAARTLDASLKVFWPGDAKGKNDACEANVVVHLAHAALSRGFAVFSEATYPEPGERLDLLAIAPDRKWYMAAEIKRLQGGGNLAFGDDIKKLVRYGINPFMPPEWCEPELVAKLTTSAHGYGLVGGVRCVKRARACRWQQTLHPQPGESAYPNVLEALSRCGGATILDPVNIEGCGRTEYTFHLLGAMIPLARSS